MKKLKAFTLIEVLVAMSLSGIVVSASYFCYNTVTRQFSSFRKANSEAMHVVLLRSLLAQDICSLPYMKANSEYEVELFSDKRKVSYSFDTDHILRTQNTLTDTFDLRTEGLQMLFEREKPQAGMGIINELSFTVQFPDTACAMHFMKEYDPGIMMKQQMQFNF